MKVRILAIVFMTIITMVFLKTPPAQAQEMEGPKIIDLLGPSTGPTVPYPDDFKELVDLFNGIQDTTKIEGIPLQGYRSEATTLFIPILGCLCVKEPCGCDKWDPFSPIIWLPRDKVVNIEKTGRKNANGLAIVRYSIRADAEITVETRRTFNVAEFKMASSIFRSADEPRVLYSGPPPFGWTAAVFGAGYWVGSKIDKGTGASDKISDWVIDNIGSAPDWLADLF